MLFNAVFKAVVSAALVAAAPLPPTQQGRSLYDYVHDMGEATAHSFHHMNVFGSLKGDGDNRVLTPALETAAPTTSAYPSAAPSETPVAEPETAVPTVTPTPPPTPGTTPSPTAAVSCTDNDSKTFEIDLDGGIKTDGDCNWLASKNEPRRKKYCAMKVEVKPNPSKKLSAICKRTCGLVGLGQCAADCEDKSKKFYVVVDGTEADTTLKRKNCEWVASKKKSRRRELCTENVELKNGKIVELPQICTKTCGEFGKGKCTFN